MPTYCFKCKSCGTPFMFTSREPDVAEASLKPQCCNLAVLERDYKTEFASHNVFIPLHMQGRVDVRRDDVLPTAKDFEKPGDSDGSKGFKEWKDSVVPAHKGAWV